MRTVSPSAQPSSAPAEKVRSIGASAVIPSALNGRQAIGSLTLRVRVRVTAGSRIRSGNPWVFADSIRDQNREGRLGELAVIYDRNDRFLAVGLYDPESPIRIGILHAGKPKQIDQAWWRARLDQTLAGRSARFDERTTGYRLINGESDGWPGLVLDRYERTFVVKLYTAAWLPRLAEIADILRAVEPIPGRTPEHLDRRSNGGSLILRLSRNIQRTAAGKFAYKDGQSLRGKEVNGPVLFKESGLRFEADVRHGQKTGFFLDQRENRRLVESLARGREVLNGFSFSGGFSLYAARGGARSVTDLDISELALTGAKRNFALNRDVAAVASCRHDTIRADAFAWLIDAPFRTFDVVILDPPSLAKRESERAAAIQAYGRLASLSIQRLGSGGILVAAS